jgi:hypothetical protein
MRRLAALAVAVLALVLVPAAQATQRYAAPAGAGPKAECAQTSPCSLKDAVEGAQAGDEVIVTAGTYPVSATVELPSSQTNVQVHGDLSGPMPRITGALENQLIELYEAGDSLSYLEIENDANTGRGVYCTDGRLERMRIRVVGAGGTGVLAYPDCNSIRNSLLLVEGIASTALREVVNFGNYTLAARNLTMIATGTGSSGATVEYAGGGAGSATLELENSIVRGGEQDLKPVGSANGGATVAATHSNFVNVKPGTAGKLVDGGGNQTAAPLFVNAEAGNYREAPGSPTIDAGLGGELGPLDLEGNPRAQGAAPDIGAFEISPPPAPPAANGQLESLAIKPAKFRAGNVSGAAPSRRRAAPGAWVTYTLSAPAMVEFHVERAGTGRRAGGKCVKQTHANRGHKKCVIYKPMKGRFSIQAPSRTSSFRFSGKIGGRLLKPGPYRLVGSAGDAIRRASFTIVK